MSDNNTPPSMADYKSNYLRYLFLVGTVNNFSLVLLSSSVAICSAFIGHQQITPHTISILELFVLNSIASKVGFSELQVHSLVHSNILLSTIYSLLPYAIISLIGYLIANIICMTIIASVAKKNLSRCCFRS
jgi:hypothetical protein